MPPFSAMTFALDLRQAQTEKGNKSPKTDKCFLE